MPEQRQIQNALWFEHYSSHIRWDSGEDSWERCTGCGLERTARILISKGGARATCSNPEAQLYLFTLQLSLPCSAPYLFTKAGPRSFYKIHYMIASSRGPCLQLVLFERNLAKFYHRRIPPAKLTAGKSCV